MSTASEKKRLLMVGGSFADVPIIEAALDLGFYVISTGNQPSHPGHQLSHEYVQGDFSDPKAILEIARAVGAEFVCSGCNDFCAIACSYVAENLGLPGHDSVEVATTLHHKDLFRKFAAAHNLSSPRSRTIFRSSQAEAELGDLHFPLIVKPIDLSGGKGIARVDSLSQLEHAVESAFSRSKADRIVVEEFRVGTHHAYSCFVRDGSVLFEFVDREQYHRNPYMVAGTYAPSGLSSDVVCRVRREAEALIGLCRLSDGILHIQFVVEDDIPYLIEVCRRPPGDLYLKFVQKATGFDYARSHVLACTGIGVESLREAEVSGFHSRYCLMTDRAGEIVNVEFDPELQVCVKEQMDFWSPGFQVEDWNTDKLGIVFLEFSSHDEMVTKSAAFYDLFKVEFLEEPC